MVTKNNNKNSCVLGISPSSRGFGYAMMTNGDVLVDWGVKVVKSCQKNEQCLARFAELIETYEPSIIALEKCSKHSRRGQRIQMLIEEIADLARDAGLEVGRFSRKQVNVRILRTEDATKFEIALKLADRYPEQLAFRIPRKRRLWMSEAYQMDIFDALALAKCALRCDEPAEIG